MKGVPQVRFEDKHDRLAAALDSGKLVELRVVRTPYEPPARPTHRLTARFKLNHYRLLPWIVKLCSPAVSAEEPRAESSAHP